MSQLFITGFMGAGKSTVGRLVAERLGWAFVDLDAEIERREGASVSEIFGDRGETGFREAEHAALEAFVGRAPAVVATGGGVVLREDNQVLLKRHGTVVYLAVTPEEALARLGDSRDRPLLAAGDLAAARSILASRFSLYAATADRVVDTVGLTAEEVADAVVAGLPESADVIEVGLPGSSDAYSVLVGGGLLADVAGLIAGVAPARSVALVTDETVWGIAGEAVLASLLSAGSAVSTHIIAPGEQSKSWDTAGALLAEFADAGLDRGSAVVALGGGVVGDLAGFCAATFMRGIALVHLPTTLLAQVDSAIGGKTAVDLAAGKNLAGAFWPPKLVLADTRVLDSLPVSEWTNGLVEVAKAALLAGGENLGCFAQQLPAIMRREPEAVREMVLAAAAFKANVVTDDLREADRRECLNLGHTLGHALELLSGYGTLSHGLAVAEGIGFAARLAELVAGAPGELTVRTDELLEAVGAGRAARSVQLRSLVRQVGPAQILAAMKVDKKSRDGVVRFVVLDAPGAWRVVPVDDELLYGALERWAAEVYRGGAA